MTRWIFAAALTLATLSSPASAQYIGIFMDPSATSCAASVGAKPWIDLHVILVLEGSELRGTQFQITGAPATWNAQNVLWVPDIGLTISLGHPLFPNAIYDDSGGANLVFSDCVPTIDTDKIPLGRLVILGAPTPEDVHLRVEGVQLGLDPDCPFRSSCELLNIQKLCVGGGEAFLNGQTNVNCTVAVEETTWTQVRLLFR